MSTKLLFWAVASLFLAAALAPQGHAAAVSATYDNALNFVNLTVLPNPVVAGGKATIRFQLYNSYGYWIYDTSLQASGSYPLFNVSPSNSYVIGQMNPGLNTQYFNYTVAIPNTTQSGTYNVYFNATYYVLGATGTAVSASSKAVSFFVQNKPEIKVVASNSQPSALYSGYNQTVSLLIENIGYGTARNVSVSLAGGHGANLLSSVTTFFIPNLTAGSSVAEPVLLSSENVNRTSIIASTSYYSSSFKQHFTSSQSVNLSVAPAAQFSIDSHGSNANIGSTDSAVTFRITNTGTSEARQLQLSLETGYPVTPVASTAYINDLAAGASANVTFLVSVDSAGVAGNYPVTIYEQWKQPNGSVNQQFSGSNNYAIGVGSAKGNGELFIIAGAVALVIIAVFAVRARSKKQAKTKK